LCYQDADYISGEFADTSASILTCLTFE